MIGSLDLRRTVDVPLNAGTENMAREEIARRWPDLEIEYIGLDRRGEAVLLSWVRKRGDTREAPTAIVPDSAPAVRFIARIPS
jgi:hypothetical protein